MKTIRLTTIIMIGMLFFVACSSAKNEVGGKVPDTIMNEINQHIPDFCDNSGLDCTNIEFKSMNTPELTQEEKDAGVLDRRCGTVTFQYTLDEEDVSETVFAIIEKDRLGWTGLYDSPFPSVIGLFVDDDGYPIESPRREIWEEKGCGRAEDFDILDERKRYGGMLIDGLVDDWADGKCPMQKDDKDSDAPEWLDLKGVCTKVGEDYLFVLMEFGGPMAMDAGEVDYSTYLLTLTDTIVDDIDESEGVFMSGLIPPATTAFGMAIYIPGEDERIGSIGKQQDVDNATDMSNFASAFDGKYLEWALPISPIENVFLGPLYLNVTTFSSPEAIFDEGSTATDFSENSIMIWSGE